MKLLLDTHIWIWAIDRPEKLSRNVRRQIENPANELYLSPVSVWEAYHLHQRRRLRIKQDFAGWVTDVLKQVPVQEAPLNFSVALETSRIQLPEPDLGDLFLAATALVFDLTLVTADDQLLECKWLKVLANE